MPELRPDKATRETKIRDVVNEKGHTGAWGTSWWPLGDAGHARSAGTGVGEGARARLRVGVRAR